MINGAGGKPSFRYHSKAEELGCEIVKLFPGDLYESKFVKAIKDPQSLTSIMSTGGVFPTKENLEVWFNAGVNCVGMGSQLISKEVVQKGNFDKLKQVVKETLRIIKTSQS